MLYRLLRLLLCLCLVANTATGAWASVGMANAGDGVGCDARCCDGEYRIDGSSGDAGRHAVP